MSDRFLEAAKKSLRRWHRKLLSAYIQQFHSFTKADFANLLSQLGIQQRDAILVHSSFGQFQGFTGNVSDVINALQEAVGPDGIVMMPTMPFNGTAIEWASQDKILDIKKTPSRMGLISEMFRRRRDVVRSVHPTHPVAVWGSRKDMIVKDSLLTTTPCGAFSPFAKLEEEDGKVLFLGTPVMTMTFFHTVEEMLEPQMPFSPFTKDYYILRARDAQGNVVTARLRLLDPYYGARRDDTHFNPLMKQNGWWKEGKVGRLNAICLKAQDIVRAVRMLADRGIFTYKLG